jgi:UDP-N-acetylmuramoyl-tripeptide--D-alanyl-D-alanine ligase
MRFSYLNQMDTIKLHELFLESRGVTTDSRSVLPGDIFFALRGENFDGHAFVGRAIEGGCRAAVIDDKSFAIEGKTILTDNVLLSLQQLACFHRQQFDLPVIGITGSNGKTTSKELIRDVLSSRYRTLATRGNLNNHIGVPLTLLRLEASHEIAVIEMGANHIGEIDSLCNIAMPDYGLITNIGSAHLEGFGSPEGVRKAKSELFHYLKKRGGKAFLNLLRPELIEVSREIPLDYIPFGKGEGCFVEGRLTGSGEYLEGVIKSERTGSFNLKTGLTGSYNFENVLASACIGIYFGVSPAEIKKAVGSYIPENNRSQIIQTPNNRLLLDAYNANPDSMRAALLNFFSMPGENKLVILGDMFEMGPYAIEEHQKIIELLREHDIGDAILVGREFSGLPEAGNYRTFESTSGLTDWLSRNSLKNRFILLKASRGLQLEKCVEFL